MSRAVPVYDDASGADETSADVTGGAPGGGLAYALLYLPFATAWLLSGVPTLSYLVAWVGSFWILYLTVGGRIKPLPADRSLFDQIMRPIVLTQIVFAGYNFISSIFFFLDINGYYYLSKSALYVAPRNLLMLTAEAQRYYVLAHAGIATGMLAAMDYRRSGEWAVRKMDNPTAFLLVLSAVSFLLALPLGRGFGQITVRLEQFGLVASVLALALAIPTRRFGLLLVAAAVYAVNLGSAFLSGYKENVLVMVILLAVFAYPYARGLVLLGAPVALLFLFAILPTYAQVFRSLNWDGTASQEEAASVAFEVIRSGQADIAATNWAFLRGRISEIGMFTEYISSVESRGQYYGTTIVEQALEGLVPRVMWPDKPITETVAMQRVYENGIVERGAEVSAKTPYVVDGYLSAGVLGLIVGAIVFGWVASAASRFAERFFGGYFWGTGLVYTSFFAVMWRGNAYEFFLNNVFWSFILLIPLMFVARWTGLLVRSDELEEEPDPSHMVGVSGGTGMAGAWSS